MALVIRVLGGLTLWCAGFSLLYGLHGLGCGLGWSARSLGPVTLLGAALIACWLAMLALAVAFLLFVRRGAGDDLLDRLALIGAWAGLVGLAFMGGPVLLPAHCA